MKKKKISVRIDAEKFAKYTELAKRNERSFSSEINHALIDEPESKQVILDDRSKAVIVALEAYLSDMMRSVKTRSNNINQIAKKVNTLKQLSDTNKGVLNKQIDSYKADIKREIRQLKSVQEALDRLYY